MSDSNGFYLVIHAGKRSPTAISCISREQSAAVRTAALNRSLANTEFAEYQVQNVIRGRHAGERVQSAQ